MSIKFNYRYYVTETETEQHQLAFDTPSHTAIAYKQSDVGHVVREAERLQQAGYYVALYLAYEAAVYFNPEMAVHTCPEGTVYVACYAYEAPCASTETSDVQHVHTPAKNGFEFSETYETMYECIQAIHRAITEGETYQVNYTTRLTRAVETPISTLYAQLIQYGHGNYTALIDTEALQIASLSPELFFQKGPFKGEGDCVVSKPMKGTMPRGNTAEQDAHYREQLRQSTKDRAENVMIVDLLRNDITRIATYGSIEVLSPFRIEAYDTVFQMTSMVKGRLQPETTLETMLTALFPCGSITGAPKINTMKYIKALETTARQAYCGSIGLLCPDGKMIFNVAIRTIQHLEKQAVYGVGAGITINSIPENEIQEFKDKTRILEEI